MAHSGVCCWVSYIRTESCVAIAYTIRYGSENKTVAALLPASVDISLASTGVGGPVSTTGGGRAAIVPSEDVSMVKFSVSFGGPVRNL